MKTKVSKALLALALCCLVLLCACGEAAEPSATPGSETEATPAPEAEATPAPEAEATPAPENPASELDPEPYPGYNMEQQVAAKLAEANAKHPPKVKTLDNGVQVQRTPTDPTLHNTYTLKADSRGCAACHDDLNQTLLNMPQGHLEVEFYGEIPLNVQHCIGCHTYSPDYVTEFYQFGAAVHGLHSGPAFSNMGGTCLSCHDADYQTGEMKLWDEVKYDRFRGIVDADASKGTFSFDQTTTIGQEDIFSLNWLYGWNDYYRYQDYVEGVELDPEVFDNWEVSVEGMVDNPITYTLRELIDMGLSETTTMAMHCTMNPPGGGLIANCEVTGIPIQKLLELAGVQEGAIEVYTMPIDDACTYPTTLEWLEDHEALLVYEVDGKPLSVVLGYPLQSWVAGMGAPNFAKQVTKLIVADDPVEDLYIYVGWIREEEGRFFNKPNTAIFFTQEGQIIDAYEPYTFEGYADAYDDPIVAVEISMDRGATWTRFETPGAEVGKWVYWRYTFTPAAEGAYVLMVRAVTESGLVSETNTSIMVNAVAK